MSFIPAHIPNREAKDYAGANYMWPASEDQKLPISLSKGIALSGESLIIAYPEK